MGTSRRESRDVGDARGTVERASNASARTRPAAGPTAGGPDLDDPLLARLRAATRGEYDVLLPLGRGGMAAVYLARDVELARDVAIKVMLPELLQQEAMPQRFLLEARTAALLDDHPNVVRVYTASERAGLRFFVMKYIDGCSLEQLLHATAPLSVDVACDILAQVTRALQHAHQHHVVHRDVKPANVMLDRQGVAVVTDFGIARAARSERLTRVGLMVGTPAFMSPEQWRDEEFTAASDQYALGVVAYQMLTGLPPFGGSLYELQSAHLYATPRPVRAIRADCPARLESLVHRMLAKDPAARWPGLSAVEEELMLQMPAPLPRPQREPLLPLLVLETTTASRRRSDHQQLASPRDPPAPSLAAGARPAWSPPFPPNESPSPTADLPIALRLTAEATGPTAQGEIRSARDVGPQRRAEFRLAPRAPLLASTLTVVGLVGALLVSKLQSAEPRRARAVDPPATGPREEATPDAAPNGSAATHNIVGPPAIAHDTTRAKPRRPALTGDPAAKPVVTPMSGGSANPRTTLAGVPRDRHVVGGRSPPPTTAASATAPVERSAAEPSAIAPTETPRRTSLDTQPIALAARADPSGPVTGHSPPAPGTAEPRPGADTSRSVVSGGLRAVASPPGAPSDDAKPSGATVHRVMDGFVADLEQRHVVSVGRLLSAPGTDSATVRAFLTWLSAVDRLAVTAVFDEGPMHVVKDSATRDFRVSLTWRTGWLGHSWQQGDAHFRILLTRSTGGWRTNGLTIRERFPPQ